LNGIRRRVFVVHHQLSTMDAYMAQRLTKNCTVSRRCTFSTIVCQRHCGRRFTELALYPHTIHF